MLFLLAKLRGVGQINLVGNPGFDSVDCRAFEVYDWELQGALLAANEFFPIIPSPGSSFKVPHINPNPWGYSDAFNQTA